MNGTLWLVQSLERQVSWIRLLTIVQQVHAAYILTLQTEFVGNLVFYELSQPLAILGLRLHAAFTQHRCS